MKRPRLLWIPFQGTTPARVLLDEAANRFDVVQGTPALAVRDVERIRPDVVVADMDHPDQTQLRMLQVLKASFPSVPVLLLTLRHSESLAVWAFRARMWNYMPKPVTPEELRADLERLLPVARAETPGGRAMRTPTNEIPKGLPVVARDPEASALDPAIFYVEAHFRERIRETDVARLAGLSASAFSREFHAATGVTFVDYVTALRISEAKRLLRQPEWTVTDVCYAVGFNDVSYFGRVFRQHVGESPSAWAGRAGDDDTLETAAGEAANADDAADDIQSAALRAAAIRQ